MVQVYKWELTYYEVDNLLELLREVSNSGSAWYAALADSFITDLRYQLPEVYNQVVEEDDIDA